MNTTHIIQGLFLGLLFIGTVSFGQFLAPSGNPATSGSNSIAALSASTTDQIKDGDFAASFITGTEELCLGASCISSWWPTTEPTTCKLLTKQIQNITTGTLDVYNMSCEKELTQAARDEGWVSTGFDYCTNLSGGNCNNLATCSYMRLACTGSATSTAPLSTMYTTFPTTDFGDGYIFLQSPQCNDGINNDALTGIDYPADPQCLNYADNDEAN